MLARERRAGWWKVPSLWNIRVLNPSNSSRKQPHVFRLHRSRVYYIRESLLRQAVSVPRANLISLGVCLGKFSKTEKFRLHVTALDLMGKYAKNKVRVVLFVLTRARWKSVVARLPGLTRTTSSFASCPSPLAFRPDPLIALPPGPSLRSNPPGHPARRDRLFFPSRPPPPHRSGSSRTARCRSCTGTTSSRPTSARRPKTLSNTKESSSTACRTFLL